MTWKTNFNSFSEWFTGCSKRCLVLKPEFLSHELFSSKKYWGSWFLTQLIFCCILQSFITLSYLLVDNSFVFQKKLKSCKIKTLWLVVEKLEQCFFLNFWPTLCVNGIGKAYFLYERRFFYKYFLFFDLCLKLSELQLFCRNLLFNREFYFIIVVGLSKTIAIAIVNVACLDIWQTYRTAWRMDSGRLRKTSRTDHCFLKLRVLRNSFNTVVNV